MGSRQFLYPMKGSGPWTPAYDPFAASIVHAYEPARRVLTSYTGNLVRLRRASDNAEANFGYLANGNLDVAAIAAWAGGASYVVTVYDQAPAGDDVTMAIAGWQPLFVASIQNGRAGMRHDGTDDHLRGAFTTGGALSQPFNVFAVGKLDASVVNDNSDRVLIDSDDSTNRMSLQKWGGATPDSWVIYAGGSRVGGAADSNWHIWSVLFNGLTGGFWIDAASQNSGNAGAHNADGITIGASITTSKWYGDIAAAIIVDPSLSDAQRIAMQNAMNAYWGVY